MKWQTSSALILSLFLTACATKPSEIKDWCVLDRWMTISHQDTLPTQAEILRHNTDYKAAGCPSP